MTNVTMVYFSPNGTTRRTLQYLAAGISRDCRQLDLTPFAGRWGKYYFGPQELVLLGLPVYRGLLPAISEEYFRCLQAEQTPAILVATYGNRAYGNALLELKEKAERCGFSCLAAVAAVGEHAVSREFAGGRPDAADREILFYFGRRILDKYLQQGRGTLPAVPGNRPYEQGDLSRTPLITDGNCNNCGTCAAGCPVAAINPADCRETDTRRCIGCMRCVHNCRRQARFLEKSHYDRIVAMLRKTAAIRREPELFL
ncbi:MAG: (4Fe-4S)-binding protein [Firmicutes bacterium]|nr:(4Fe-4S)-binding protein [Bacillota bacterium]